MIEAYFDKIETQIAQKLSSATNKVYLAVAWFTNETLYEKILKCCQSDVTVCVVIMNDYINNDITLTEIAENRNITSQAVKDVVGKVEKKLLIYEEKLGFNKKRESLKKDKSRKED